MPACWPIVVERSAGVMRVAMAAMIRGVPSVRPIAPSWRPGSPPAALPPVRRAVAAARRCRGSRRRSAAASSVWIKREDLLPLAFGGNKLRNLEFLVGAALAEGADTLVTTGRRWSNHARLTAAAGARAGLAVHLVLSGPPADPPEARASCSTSSSARPSTRPRPTTAPSARRSSTQVVADLRAAGRRPFVIGVGGTRRGRGGRPGARRDRGRRPGRAAGVASTAIVAPVGDRRDPGRAARRAAARPASATAVAGVVVARPADELRPSIAATVREASRALGPALDLLATARSTSTTTQLGAGYGRRPPPPTRRPRSSPGPRASSSTRSTPPRRWPGSSPRSATGALDGGPSSSGTPAAAPGLFEPLD